MTLGSAFAVKENTFKVKFLPQSENTASEIEWDDSLSKGLLDVEFITKNNQYLALVTLLGKLKNSQYNFSLFKTVIKTAEDGRFVVSIPITSAVQKLEFKIRVDNNKTVTEIVVLQAKNWNQLQKEILYKKYIHKVKNLRLAVLGTAMNYGQSQVALYDGLDFYIPERIQKAISVDVLYEHQLGRSFELSGEVFVNAFPFMSNISTGQLRFLEASAAISYLMALGEDFKFKIGSGYSSLNILTKAIDAGFSLLGSIPLNFTFSKVLLKNYVVNGSFKYGFLFNGATPLAIGSSSHVGFVLTFGTEKVGLYMNYEYFKASIVDTSANVSVSYTNRSVSIGPYWNVF